MITTMPSIAVLLAAYNGEKWIEEQIESIINQKNVMVHIFVSVDLSTDNTLGILDMLSLKHANITILNRGEIFGSPACNFYHLIFNTPIEEYDYIAFSDQDDIWLENKLFKAVNKLETHQAMGYSSDVNAFMENGKKKIIKKSYPQKEYDYLFEAPGPGCSFVLKKELLLLIKKAFITCPFLKKMDWYDWLIYAFSRANKYKWVIDNCSYILYRQHNNNYIGVNFGWPAFLKRVKKVTSGYAMNQSILVIKFLQLENDPFVKTWYRNGMIHYLKLSLSAKKCRRNISDQFIFFLACIVMYMNTSSFHPSN